MKAAYDGDKGDPKGIRERFISKLGKPMQETATNAWWYAKNGSTCYELQATSMGEKAFGAVDESHCRAKP